MRFLAGFCGLPKSCNLIAGRYSVGVRANMSSVAVLERARLEGWSDEEVVARVVDGDTAMFEILMRRHNQRLYRVARAILRDDSEAEDEMQDAYVRAYQHLHQFEGR